jgi:hypothetical protein
MSSQGPPASKTQHASAGALRVLLLQFSIGCVVAAAFCVNVQKYYFLSDDAFISFRYADNFVSGDGLVFNAGERVEGYTNFLWVLLMAGGLTFDLPPEVLSNVLGIASGAAILGVLARFHAGILGWHSPFVWVIPAVLAVSRTFTAWCTGGLATQFFSLWLLLGLLAFGREYRRREPWPWRSALCLVVAALTRPEGNLVAFGVGLFFVGAVVARRWSMRALLRWVAAYGSVIGAHLAWRLTYYGEWLPNTFYAKVDGAWFEQSARFFELFLSDYKLHWFLPFIVLGALFRRSVEAAVFGIVTVLYLAYVAYIGGDRFEFRFLVIVLPYLYFFLVEGLVWFRSMVARGLGRRVAGWLAAGLALLLLGITHLGSVRPESRADRSAVASVQRLGAYGAMRSRVGQKLRYWIDLGALPQDMLVGMSGVGAVPYYTRWPTLDFLGLNDKVIARSPPTGDFPGHRHRATDAYKRERGVVVEPLFGDMILVHDQRRLRLIRSREGQAFRCVVLGRQTFLPFRSYVSEFKLRQLLGHLKACDVREANAGVDLSRPQGAVSDEGRWTISSRRVRASARDCRRVPCPVRID